jgi:hypothetical protein
MAAQTMENSIRLHLGGLEGAVEFLETSDALNNLLSLFSGEEGEEGEETSTTTEDDAFEIDLTEITDDVVAFMHEHLMVEETSTLSADGLSLSYQVTGAFFCVQDPDEDESPESKKDRLREQAECAERLGENPLRIDVMSDAVGDLNLGLFVGSSATPALDLQLHDDQISAYVALVELPVFLKVFVSPEDFELPRSMQGLVGVEVRQHGVVHYTARFAIEEEVHLSPDPDQDPYTLDVPVHLDPGQITFDGSTSALNGELLLSFIHATLPWQFMVDLFHDDEGYSEWTCEYDEVSEIEECWDEWIEPPDAAEVDEVMTVFLPGLMGAVDYAAGTDTFAFTGLGLGDMTTTVNVDGASLIEIDLNEEGGRTLDLSVGSPGEHDVSFTFGEEMNLEVLLAWEAFRDDFEDLPDFLLDETLGVYFSGSSSPEIQILDVEEDTEVQVVSGQLTLWSTAMDEDVVIEEGQCMTGIDEEVMTEEELDALHDLFGRLMGTTCEG